MIVIGRKDAIAEISFSDAVREKDVGSHFFGSPAGGVEGSQMSAFQSPQTRTFEGGGGMEGSRGSGCHARLREEKDYMTRD